MSIPVTTSLCPTCSEVLEPLATEHGIVWVCRRCRAFAANLAVLRKAAPRQFVKHLWLAGLELGIPSSHRCPSCEQPLRRFGADVEVSPACEMCCRCFLVWFDDSALQSLQIGSDDPAAGRAILSLARRALT